MVPTLVIGGHNLANQPMTDDITTGQLDNGNSLNVAQTTNGVNDA